MNIFTYGSPLHDGAVIIAEGRIKAASCYLPLTMDPTLSRTYGTRHRAAIGITEESDALAIVVSEERGIVSLAESGKIVQDLDAQGLAERLRQALAPPAGSGRDRASRAVRS
jgi:diadenylate cyclase